MWLFLRFGRKFVLESGECHLYISGHGEMHPSVGVIPFECDAQVASSRIVDRDVVVVPEGIQEVLLVLLLHIFYTKIIHVQGEGDVSCFMQP